MAIGAPRPHSVAVYLAIPRLTKGHEIRSLCTSTDTKSSHHQLACLFVHSEYEDAQIHKPYTEQDKNLILNLEHRPTTRVINN